MTVVQIACFQHLDHVLLMPLSIVSNKAGCFSLSLQLSNEEFYLLIYILLVFALDATSIHKYECKDLDLEPYAFW